MNTYVVLLRGVNVGGKNAVPMARLKSRLEELGYLNVTTYIASGNIILQTDNTADAVTTQIEHDLPRTFSLDSTLIRVLVIPKHEYEHVVKDKPPGFGESPDTYHSDVIFLMDFDVQQALSVFNPREGVDTIWPGKNVIYSQRLSSQRTKSRLNKIMGTTAYRSMTIRNWNTTTKLLELLQEI